MSEAALISLELNLPKISLRRIKYFQLSELMKLRLKVLRCTNGQGLRNSQQLSQFFQHLTTVIFTTIKALLSNLKYFHPIS